MTNATQTNGSASSASAKPLTVRDLIDFEFPDLHAMVQSGEITVELAGQVMAEKSRLASELKVANALKDAPVKVVKGGANKTVCPVTLDEFFGAAEALEITIGGVQGMADVKAPFSTGSFGWNYNGKIDLRINGKMVRCQVGLNITVANSKEAPRS